MTDHGNVPAGLVALVADKNIEYGVKGLLERPNALGVRSIAAEGLVHQRHDPGCLCEAHNLLRPLARAYGHALVIFDLEGSGRDATHREALEVEIRVRLEVNGWDDRAEVIVIDPELNSDP